MDLDSDTNLDLANDGASDAVSQPLVQSSPETVSGTVREAFDRAKEVAEANGDPEKLEEIRVRRAKDGRFERGEGNDARDATGERKAAPKAKETGSPDRQSEQPEAQGIEKPALEQASAPLALRPPPGWSAQARADYAKLPPHIQQAVAQREVEVNKGFERLKDYSGLETHLPRIKASNLTPAQFVDNAVKWEDSLKSNPEHTVMQAIKLGGLDPVRLSAKILQQAGFQIGPRTGQPPRQAEPPPVNVQYLVRQELAQRDQAAAQQKWMSEAEAFLTDPKNIHAEDVVDDMVALIKGGRAKDFATAYDMAIHARPDIRETLIKQRLAQPSNGNQRRPVDQARAAAKATVGAPSGLAPARQASALPKTVRDAARLAFAQAMDAD